MKIVQNSFNHNLYIHTLILNIENTFNTQIRKVLIIALMQYFCKPYLLFKLQRKVSNGSKRDQSGLVKFENAMNHML